MKCEICSKDYTEEPYKPMALPGKVGACDNIDHWNHWNTHVVRLKNMAVETKSTILFLKHPAGFSIDCGGLLCLRPIDEYSPPKRWEVDWSEWDEAHKMPSPACPYFHSKEFDNLEEASKFFVEKRYEMKLGLDLEKIEK